jgi:protein tyrosine/serine phosphatase
MEKREKAMKNKQSPSLIYIPDEKDLLNFMEIKTGSIAQGILYRSSSPLKGGNEKEAKAELAIKAGINCVINLDDDRSVVYDLSKDVPWYHKLVLEGNVLCLPMTISIPGVVSNERKLKTALQFMIFHKGPYLIHCFAGVDRTGFVAALLAVLMGATLTEIVKNYLSAFTFDKKDSYHIDRKMKTILSQLEKMFHGKKITSLNIQPATEHYLLNDMGLSCDEIIKLKNILSNPDEEKRNEAINKDI